MMPNFLFGVTIGLGLVCWMLVRFVLCAPWMCGRSLLDLQIRPTGTMMQVLIRHLERDRALTGRHN